MIRVLVIFFVITVIATSAATLADNPGSLIIEALNWRIRTSFSTAIVVFAVSIILLLVIYRLLIALRRAPQNISAHVKSYRKNKGLNALAKGLVAVAAGDAGEARKYVSQTESLLENKSLSGLLGAQSAQLEGNEEKAKSYFEEMLDSPDTEFLGLRGLLAQATRDGDVKAALKFASRAFELRPKTSWTFQTLIYLQTNKGDWNGALATLERAKEAGAIDRQSERRRRAVLLTARAYQAAAQGRSAEAEEDARQAQRLMPALTHAAVLAAEQMRQAGNTRKAASILEDAWRAAPHPAIVETYVALKPDETAHERAKRLKGLAEMKPDHMESRLLITRQAINTRKWQNAREALKPLVTRNPTPRVCALMAEIEAGDDNIDALREWLARMVVAAPEPDWIRTHFDFDTLDWARLSSELGTPDATWPPTAAPSLYTTSVGSVSSFTPGLQLPDDKISDHSTHDMTDKIIAGAAAMVEKPITSDYPSAEAQENIAERKSRSAGAAAPFLTSMRPAGRLQSVNRIGENRRSPRQPIKKAESESPDTVPKRRFSLKSKKRKSRAAREKTVPPSKISDTIIPRQPDDPGFEPQD